MHCNLGTDCPAPFLEVDIQHLLEYGSTLGVTREARYLEVQEAGEKEYRDPQRI